MSEEGEISEAGHPIYRYNQPPKTFEMPQVSAENCEQISDHVKRHIGPCKSVLHELVSHLVHLDVLIVEPTERQPIWTLVTSGMSDRAMKVPEAAKGLEYVEVIIRLPANWQ